jgi:hypothetical protein
MLLNILCAAAAISHCRLSLGIEPNLGLAVSKTSLEICIYRLKKRIRLATRFLLGQGECFYTIYTKGHLVVGNTYNFAIDLDIAT